MGYLGWIPNLRGRLSFKLVGSSVGPYTSIKDKNFNTGTDVCCARVIGNRRHLHDSALPRFVRYLFFRNWLVNAFWKLAFHNVKSGKKNVNDLSTLSKMFFDLAFTSGDFYFVFLSTDKHFLNPDSVDCKEDRFRGKLFIIPVEKIGKIKLAGEEYDLSKMGWQNIKTKVNDQLDNAAIQPHPQHQNCKKVIEKLEDMFCCASLCGFEFTMCRDGFVFLYNMTSKYSEYLDKSNIDEDMLYNQAYFFLKDLTHEHQHHDPRTDSILVAKYYDLDLQNLDDNKKQLREYSDYAFKRLYRYVLDTNRRTSLSVLYTIKGFVAHIAAFRHIVQQRLGENESFLEKYEEQADKRIIYSCEARAQEESYKLQRLDVEKNQNGARNTKAIALASGALALMAFSISYISLAVLVTVNDVAKSGLPEDFKLIFAPKFFALASEVVANPSTILAIIVLIAIFPVSFFIKLVRRLDRIKQSTFISDLMRLAYAARYQILARLTFSGLALLFLGIYFWAVYQLAKIAIGNT